MALPDTERRASGSKCSKTALQEEDAISLIKEFAELKRKQREKDPEVKRVKNKYRLKPLAYPSPGNILHTGRQLTRTPGPGVLPLLPSQEFGPRDPEHESFDQLRSFPLSEINNVVPCGKQLPRTPDQCHVLREIQPSAILSRTACKSDTCNATPVIRNAESAHISNTGREKEIPMGEVRALPDAERRPSGWKCSKTALEEEDAANLLKEFAELKRKERENDPKVKGVKKKYNLKASAYPSPGNILHTARQLPRSPVPGGLPLLPSQIFEPQEDENESFNQVSSVAVKDLGNLVPSGKHLSRTPAFAEPGPRGVQPNGNNVIGTQELSPIVHNLEGGNATETLSHEEDLNMADTSNDLQNKKPESTEDVKMSNHHAPNIRRISELPVQGLNQMRISGVLKKMPGYECRSEDLEFLTYMKTQEKAKALKEELLDLRKHLSTTRLDKELLIAKKDKIDHDIQRMKSAHARTLCLGRAFLSRTLDAASVHNLTAQDVLKQLNHLTVQEVHQQERAQLHAAQKELARRREEVSARRNLDDPKSSLISKIESCKKCVHSAEERLQQLNDEVITLKTQIEKAETKKCELTESVKQKREQISQLLEQHSAVPAQTGMSEEDRERMNRSIQRILHRKKLYVERERILRKLKRDLK